MTITETAGARAALPVSIERVARSFPAERAGESARVVLRDVDLELHAGEIVALIGPSGCGKSTLLRQVSGLDAPSSGRISIGDAVVDGIDLRCAVAFQEPRLLPWRTLENNVALGLPPGTDREAGRRRVADLLDLVGLGASKHLRPRQVSGGMAQRASLARALARGPGVLVLDEPFGALDALTRLNMQDLLLEVHGAEPATVLLVTHDVDEALYLADRVVLLAPDSGGSAGRVSAGRVSAGRVSAGRVGAGQVSGSTIQRVIEVPGRRPRDRGDAVLAQLRAELLTGLGVDSHHDDPLPGPIIPSTAKEHR